MTDAQLAEVEDRAVLDAIELQESAGLDVLTDGEMRRLVWADTVNHLENIVPRHVTRSYPANPGASGAESAGGRPVALGGSADLDVRAEEQRRALGFPTVVGRATPKPGEPLGHRVLLSPRPRTHPGQIHHGSPLLPPPILV